MRRFISEFFRRLKPAPSLAQLARIDRHINAELRRTRLGV